MASSKENAAPSAAPMGGSTLTASSGVLQRVQPRVTKEEQRQMDVKEKKSAAAVLLGSAFAQRKLTGEVIRGGGNAIQLALTMHAAGKSAEQIMEAWKAL